jgi:xanthine/uracil permease
MVIGGLFLLYGVILIVAGAFGSIVNVWTGIPMAVFGGAFVLWARLRGI